MTVEDPFASVADFRTQARNQIITAGRYRLPNRDGSHRPGGWQRATNLCSSISDQFGLRLWEHEQVMTALASRPDLVEAAREMFLRLADVPKKERREAVEEFLERCKEVSGGNAGSKFGNSRHSLVEADHLAMPLPATDAYARRHLSLYKSALVRNDLRAVEGMQERRVLVEALGVIGTLDNILEDLRTGLLHIGDLKTQKRFWTWLETAAQFAVYANADAMWEAAPEGGRAGRWVDMPQVSRDMAFTLWMPREPVDAEKEPGWEPHVDIYEVDIVAGWATANLCHAVTLDRAGGKSAKKPRAWLREAPLVTLTEQYAARLAAVDTREEGAALVAEIKKRGLWTPVLADEAGRAAQRISNLNGAAH